MEKKEIFTDCTLCYHSCGTVVTVENGRAVKISGMKSHPLSKGKLCVKGANALEIIYSDKRLKKPLKRENGEFKEISWDQALDEISEKLTKIKDRYGAESIAAFSGSIGVENYEMSSLVHLFLGAIGSPNFFSVESICYRMRILARQLMFGRYFVEEPDSNLYILWGHNPHESDFPLKNFIEENLKKGSKLVVIDPKKIPFAEKADLYLKIRPGTDLSLALALINVIIYENLYDKEFVEKYTCGFEELKEHVRQFTPDWAEKITSIKAKDIIKLARLYASVKGASIHQGICTLDQTKNGFFNSIAISILQAITGNINISGGWVYSPPPRLGYFGLKPTKKPLGADEYPLFYELFGKKTSCGVVSVVPDEIEKGKLKTFFVIGGNPLVTMPNSGAFKSAFEKLDLVVVYDLFLTETAKKAHYVLPACSHIEKWGVAYTYNVCHSIPFLMLRKKCIEPLYDSWSEWKFFTELSKRLNLEKYFPWKKEEEFVDSILKPTGFSFDYLLNEKPEGVFYAEKKYEIHDRLFKTSSGKIDLCLKSIEGFGFGSLPRFEEPLNEDLKKDYPLILTVGNRIKYFTHSQHRQSSTLLRFCPEPVAEINSKTGKKFGIEDGEKVKIKTPSGSIAIKVKFNDNLIEDVVLVPHGWSGEANGNLLTDHNLREKFLGYPEFKSLQARIENEVLS